MKAPKFLKPRGNRLLFFGSILICCVIGTIYFSASDANYAKNLLDNYLQPNTSKVLLVAIPVIVGIIMIGLSNEILGSDLHNWFEDKEIEDEISNENIEPDVKLFYKSLKNGLIEEKSNFEKFIGLFFEKVEIPKSLKGRYQERYESKLDSRLPIKLEVNKEWKVKQPKTYKFDAGVSVSSAIETIRKEFEEKGRLLIVGSPGSGKTVLLLKLAIELLGKKYKKERKIPVIFNLASWSNESDKYNNFEDWLIDVLNLAYGLSKDLAKTLLQQNRIIFLLDGLDELARNKDEKKASETRAKCLDSLNDYLRMGRKAVICCRRKEFVEMKQSTKQDAPVSAKVEVLDLTKADIEYALSEALKVENSRTSANNLLGIIETNEVFLEVLSTPFYFTLALEVFDKPLLSEKDFPTTVDTIKTYLKEKFIERKISNARNLTEFEKDTKKIKKWLKWLAKLIEKEQLVTFELADLQPVFLNHKNGYKIFIVLIMGLISLCFNLNYFFMFPLFLILTRVSGTGKFQILPNNWFSFKKIFNGLIVGLVAGLVTSFIYFYRYKMTAPSLESFFASFEVDIINSAPYIEMLTLALYGMSYGFLFGLLNNNQINTNEIQELQIRNLLSIKKWFVSLKKSYVLKAVSIFIILDITYNGLTYLLHILVDDSDALVNTIVGDFRLRYIIVFLVSYGISTLIMASFFDLSFRISKFALINKPYQRILSNFILDTIKWSCFFNLLIIINLLAEKYLLENYGFSKTTTPNISTILIGNTILGILFTPAFHHAIVRLYLWFEGAIPLQYATFLNYASDARILEKEGGHWRFRHQNLQEYFANNDKMTT